MKAPGSPSSQFTMTYFGSPGALRTVSHFRPVGKPPPPRPLRFDFLISPITCSGVIWKRALPSAL